jgi:CheY-like chemotaxis protein/anti-sigma regulatory factor (Ser/Thr protein kinase)
MTNWRVLAVDDEPINLEIITEALRDLDCIVDRAGDGEEAWRLLGTSATYDLVILDRMMPRLDGLALLRRIKTDSRFRRLPVIMQTAASAPEQVRDGIEAGAYYYLTKPYEPRALLAIVRAALSELGERLRAMRVDTGVDAFGLATSGQFRFHNLDQARSLATLLSGLCPDPTTAAIGLGELLINAVEHGNLGISYDEKTRLRLDNAWDAEIARRLVAPEWRDRHVDVGFQRADGAVEFVITDQGQGFDATRYLDFEPARACDPNGRGIAMARCLSFRDLEFHGNGNIVVARVKSESQS